MTTTTLDHLVRVDPREVWANEASDFTPWLAQPQNIAILAETLHLADPEVEATERAIGDFSADIVAKDRDGYVLIENQLQQTDHMHLGQILTYLSGLDGPTKVVWIATHIREEHRAAIDWLNANTPNNYSFFAVEIELFRIGSSPAAPHFSVVAKPNEWSRHVSSRSRQLTETALDERQQRYLEFWTAFSKRLYEHDPSISARPSKDYWWALSLGRTNFSLTFSAGARDHWICVEVYCHDDADKLVFDYLEAQKEEIESEFGDALEWERLDGRKGSRIAVRWRQVDPMDREQWPDLFDWYLDRSDRLRRCFAPRIKVIDTDALARAQAEAGVS